MQIRVVENSSVSLMCFVTAFPKPDIFWMIKGSILSNLSTTIELSPFRFSSYLPLGNVTIYSGGSYSCHANNTFGAGNVIIEVAVSGEEYIAYCLHVNLCAHVQALDVSVNQHCHVPGSHISFFCYHIHFSSAPPSILLISAKNSTFEGENITLRCEAIGLPLPSITWVTDSQAGLSTEYLNHFTVVYQETQNCLGVSELIIQNATLPWRGNYICLANNTLGVVEDQIAVTIYGKE